MPPRNRKPAAQVRRKICSAGDDLCMQFSRKVGAARRSRRDAASRATFRTREQLVRVTRTDSTPKLVNTAQTSLGQTKQTRPISVSRTTKQAKAKPKRSSLQQYQERCSRSKGCRTKEQHHTYPPSTLTASDTCVPNRDTPCWPRQQQPSGLRNKNTMSP